MWCRSGRLSVSRNWITGTSRFKSVRNEWYSNLILCPSLHNLPDLPQTGLCYYTLLSSFCEPDEVSAKTFGHQGLLIFQISIIIWWGWLRIQGSHHYPHCLPVWTATCFYGYRYMYSSLRKPFPTYTVKITRFMWLYCKEKLIVTGIKLLDNINQSEYQPKTLTYITLKVH